MQTVIQKHRESLHLEYMRVEKELWIMKEKEKQKDMKLFFKNLLKKQKGGNEKKEDEKQKKIKKIKDEEKVEKFVLQKNAEKIEKEKKQIN